MDATCVRPKLDDKAVLTLTAADVGNTSKLMLYKTPFSPTVDNVLADFLAEEADFDGYGQQTAGPAVGPNLRSDGTWELRTLLGHFPMTGATTPNTVAGVALIDQAAARIIAYGQFPAGVVMNASGRFIDATVQLFANGQGLVDFET